MSGSVSGSAIANVRIGLRLQVISAEAMVGELCQGINQKDRWNWFDSLYDAAVSDLNQDFINREVEQWRPTLISVVKCCGV